ncbi:MAG: MBL fold metallo-hydrolase [Myxococcota bacterium]
MAESDSTLPEPAAGRPELQQAAVACLTFPGLGFQLEGASVAGVETWLRVQAWSLAIDVGRSPEVVARCKYLALTHAHMDHAGGLGQYLALRKLYAMGPSTVFAPAEACDDLRGIVQAWERLQGSPFPWTLQPMRPGDELPIGKSRWLRALATHHVVPALGYAVVERPHRLKAEFAGLPPETLRELALRGETVSTAVERIRLAVSGDTRIQALHDAPELQHAEVMALEATFLDDRRTPAHAHLGGHVHLDEWIERAELLQGQWLVPYHVSQIYSAREALRVIRERLPEALAVRTRALLPGEREPV